MTDDAHAPPPETILFVEDEALIRMDMAEFLRECGYQVHEAANANEAVVALSSKLAIDLVVTDVRMTGDMDGVALAKWIAENRPGVEVVLTSAFSRPADMSPTEKYLTKPYTGRALVELAKEALARQSLPVGPKTH
jgi:CheY-like chemotaxis protein